MPLQHAVHFAARHFAELRAQVRPQQLEDAKADLLYVLGLLLELGTDEVVVKDQDRKVYYTDGGRQVRDGGGIEPDIVKKDPTVGQLERELDRKDMFFDYASIYEAKHLEDGEKLSRAQEPLVTDEVYADFQQWVLKEMSNQVESQSALAAR